MGKNKKKSRSKALSFVAPLGPLYKDFTATDTEITPEQLEAIEKDVNALVLFIHHACLGEFKTRKTELVKAKRPRETSSKCSLKLEIPLRKHLQGQICALWRSNRTAALLSLFHTSAQRYIDELSAELEGLAGRSRLLRVICFNEAYYSLRDFSEELVKVASPFFKEYSVLYSEVCNKLFYESVAKDISELRGCNIPNSYREHVLEFNAILTNLLYNCSVNERDSDSDLLSTSDALQHMTVEEVVEYINHEENTGENQQTAGSGRKREENDAEIEEFRNKVEATTLIGDRLRPFISDDYLSHLRELLKGCKLGNNVW